MVHDCLADPEVVVDPLLDARGLGELLGLHTGTVSGSMLAWFCCGGGEMRGVVGLRRRYSSTLCSKRGICKHVLRKGW